MFVGTFEHTLDSKNRFVVPSKVRALLGESVVVSKGFDGCLELRRAADFTTYAEKMAALSSMKSGARIVARQLLANAADLQIDSAGRILLPANLLKEAGITAEITIIGVANRYEIWDAVRYAAHKQATDATFAQLAEGLDDNE